jgi:hypothetical protein
MKASMPVNYLNDCLNNKVYQANELNFKVLNQIGFFIVKDYMSKSTINRFYEIYKKSIGTDAKRNVQHLTEVVFNLKSELANILNEKQFVEFSKQFYNGNVGLYNIRIVKKDINDKNPVFLHQDIGYHHGTTDRYSFFIPLTNCNEENGGLIFVPGSHKFGYMGDAGAINDEIIPTELMLATPSVSPGDVIVMNSFTWHKSGENKSGKERIYYDIHVNDSRDPSVKKVIVGESQSEYKIDYSSEILFTNSRMQRLKNLYKKLNLNYE